MVRQMEAFLVSLGTVALAEIGDRTQLLAVVLAARYRRPAAILAGLLVASLVNHTAASLIGRWVGGRLDSRALDVCVGLGMIAMAAWLLKPEKPEAESVSAGAAGAFVAALTSFLVAEIGDPTQIATLALAAGYRSVVAVVAGSTLGVVLANTPVVLLGRSFGHRLPATLLRYAGTAAFLTIGLLYLGRALWR